MLRFSGTHEPKPPSLYPTRTHDNVTHNGALCYFAVHNGLSVYTPCHTYNYTSIATQPTSLPYIGSLPSYMAKVSSNKEFRETPPNRQSLPLPPHSQTPSLPSKQSASLLTYCQLDIPKAPRTQPIFPLPQISPACTAGSLSHSLPGIYLPHV